MEHETLLVLILNVGIINLLATYCLYRFVFYVAARNEKLHPKPEEKEEETCPKVT